MQAQDEMDAGALATGGGAAFRPVAADGFAAVFHPSPMPDASGRGLGESVRVHMKISSFACRSPYIRGRQKISGVEQDTERKKRRLAEIDHFRFDHQARRSLVPGLALRSVDGELLDPAELPSEEALRQRLLQNRVAVPSINGSELGLYPQLPSTAGLSLVFEESAYTAVFYEPCPPQLVLREHSRKNKWGSTIPGPPILERAIERSQTRRADGRLIGEPHSYLPAYFQESDSEAMIWFAGEGCSLLRRPRLAEAAELGA